MIRRFFKWLFRLAFIAVALVVIAAVVLLLTYNSILRNVVEHNIREQTGMDAEIGRFHLSLTEPTLEIQNLEIYNPTNFGGTPFLKIPEIHIEYDRDALLKKREIHITLLRLNLGELDIVKNQAGQTNIFALAGLPEQTPIAPIASNSKTPSPTGNRNAAPPSKPELAKNQARRAVPPTAAPTLQSLEQQTGFNFEHRIDVLNVSIGKLKFIDLKNPAADREQNIGLENIVIPNVKSADDFAGLAMRIYLRSDGFFESLAGPKNSPTGNAAAIQEILKLSGLVF
jgi:hypothetical protein